MKDLQNYFKDWIMDEEDIFDDNEDSSVEFEITAKKKDKKPVQVEQLFDELIAKYNRIKCNDQSDFMSGLISTDEDEKEKYNNISESICTVKLANRDYLCIADQTGERFVLLPDRDGNRFNIGDHVCIYSEMYKDYNFLVSYCSEDEYNSYSALFDGMETGERCTLLKKAKEDPEGFAIWSKLGKAKRSYKRGDNVKRRYAIRNRTEEYLKRIPLERDDLYNSINDTFSRYSCCSNNEKPDYEETLLAKMKLASMMIMQSENHTEPLSQEYFSSKFDKAKITTCENSYHRCEGWLPNILLVGKNDHELINTISDDKYPAKEISLGGVEGNDYLFGNEMSYYCSGCGELVHSLTENSEPISVILFSDVDLMGTSVRSSNPLYGLVSLLRRHKFKDFFMRGMEIDVRKIQFICQVDRIEDCPELLLREMDMIVEI